MSRQIKKPVPSKWPKQTPFLSGLLVGSASIGLLGVQMGVGWVALLALAALMWGKADDGR